MGISRVEHLDQRARIARLAERRAFDTYLRRGHVSDPQTPLADAIRSLSLKAVGDSRPTAHYTWRTARDERVRSSHAANEGRIFAWNDPPTVGHPGSQHNCRCWAEPYYGTPTVPDATLALQLHFQTDTSGREHWASIETHIRPDGSLARSTVMLRDGVLIRSTFEGSKVTSTVRLRGGRTVRIERRDGRQAFYDGDSNRAALESFLGPDGPIISPDRRFDRIEILNPLALAADPKGMGLGAAIALGLIALYNTLQAEPEALGESGQPALAMRAWQVDGKLAVSPHSLTALDLKRAGEFCKRLPDVQGWTNEAAKVFEVERLKLGAGSYGSKVHSWIKREIERLKASGAYKELEAEYSILDNREVAYGAKGSTRLDIYERAEKYVCVYDVKTGNAELTLSRIAQIAAGVLRFFGPTPFILIEVKPTP